MSPRMRTWLIYGFCLLSGLMLECGCKDSPPKVLTIRTYIDGRDTLKIQANRIWYDVVVEWK
jgi:hypothetical protein